MKDFLAEKLKLEVLGKVELLRNQKELQEKMSQIKGKSQTEQVLLLKQFIND